MKIRNNKGITGVDITVSVIILAIFVSLIANMFYNLSAIGNSINRKSEATYIAIQVIEAIKQVEYDSLPKGYVEEADLAGMTSEQAESANTTITLEELNTILGEENKIVLKNGYSVDIKVENYKKIKGEIEELEDILKRVTVTVKYNEKTKPQALEFSTVVVKQEEATL